MNLNREFALDESLAYLNHAAVAPWPVRTQMAVEQFAQQNSHWGAKHYPEWLAKEAELRQQIAGLIHAPSADDIALMKNTSEALSTVAFGLPWQRGDNVVFAQQEFPSNRIVWEALVRFGVEIRRVDIERGDNPEAALIEAVDDKTRLLSTSSVHYADGLAMDLNALSRACKAHGALFCVDAIQSIGALPFDVQACGADFAMADGHKWMLGPEGLALFYCRAELRDQLTLHQYGWHTVDNSSDYLNLEWTEAPSAKRFECGSPNMLAIHALSASLSVLQEYGLDAVYERLKENVSYLRQHLEHMHGVAVNSRAQRASGIINFSHQRIPATLLYRELMDAGVVCAHRGQGVRFSPHFYTSTAALDRALERLDDILIRLAV